MLGNKRTTISGSGEEYPAEGLQACNCPAPAESERRARPTCPPRAGEWECRAKKVRTLSGFVWFLDLELRELANDDAYAANTAGGYQAKRKLSSDA
jgi:hypothetical protein